MVGWRVEVWYCLAWWSDSGQILATLEYKTIVLELECLILDETSDRSGKSIMCGSLSRIGGCLCCNTVTLAPGIQAIKKWAFHSCWCMGIPRQCCDCRNLRRQRSSGASSGISWFQHLHVVSTLQKWVPISSMVVRCRAEFRGDHPVGNVFMPCLT